MSTEQFNQRFVKLLKDKKITQIKVAKMLDISRTAVNKWTKDGKIDDNNLEQLADFLKVDQIWLKYGTPSEEMHPISTKKINELNILHSTGEIVTWEWDLFNDTATYSDNVEKVYGVNVTSNSDFWSLMDENTKQRLNSNYEDIIKHGGAHEIDFKISKDGLSRWITSRATGVRGRNGKITKLIGISLDNTVRKEAEINLQKTQHYFNTLLKYIPKIVVFTDKEGEILATNYHDKKPEISYLKLQTKIYHFIAAEQKLVEQLQVASNTQYEFDHSTIIASYHEQNKQPYLMLVFEQL